MSDTRVASRYAKSLLDLAQEKGMLEQVRQDMLLLDKTVKQNRDYQLMLKNPIIKHDKKLAILKAIFNGKVTDMTSLFLEIITKKNREAVLESMPAEFEKQYNLKNNIQTATITTAVPLDSKLRDEFSQIVAKKTGKTIQLEEKVDPSLIGGFVLTIGDTQIDDSIKSSLQRLRNKFNDNSYISKL
ncbi:ATP synthase F1 subunit delta [Adhaeribacter terreus]|uniref:ATP synthase subunit delta n=1 Tax=Adhaeribacter terreus TaxID=529703 RepID=A0ABW0EBX1_9BACT